MIQKCPGGQFDPRLPLGSEAPWTLAAWFDYLNLRLNGIEFHQRLLRGEERFIDERVRRVFAYWKLLLEKKTFMSNMPGWAGRMQCLSCIDVKAGMVLMGNFFRRLYTRAVKMIWLLPVSRDRKGHSTL